MKKIMMVASGVLFLLSSCMKSENKCSYPDSTVTAPSIEISALQDSLNKYGITGTSLHPSGFYYKVTNPGSGNFVNNLCAKITVTYKGTFFNGDIFDQTQGGNTATFPLGGVIVGWQKGIPLVKSGGDIELYIPPTLGYGAQVVKNPTTGAVIIPASSFLVFKVHVASID